MPRCAVILTSPTHGASAGIRDAAMRRGLRLEVWTAMTDRYPTAEDAYFARDEEMIRSADLVLAFWDGESAGTAHELTYARTLSKPIDLVLVNRSPSPSRYLGGDAA
jgi:nucleoside 2-deoxyribosyltransferase